MRKPKLKQVRRSLTLPSTIVLQVQEIARKRHLSDSRILVELIEQGIQSELQREHDFFELAAQFRSATDPEQVKQLGDELGRFVFGE